LIYPKASEIIQTGDAQDIFSPNISGRINAVGVFDGFQDSIEYFYALAGPVDGVLTTGTFYVSRVDIIILDIVGTRASVQANIWFIAYNTTNTHYIAMTGWIVFIPDSALVKAYDLTLLRLDQEADIPASEYPAAIQALCAETQQRCVGDDQQFANQSECVAFMSSLDFGSWSDAWSNTVVCRELHVILTQVRPDFHCPHVGPTGGGKCIFHTYDEWLNTTYVAFPDPDTPDSTPCRIEYV